MQTMRRVDANGTGGFRCGCPEKILQLYKIILSLRHKYTTNKLMDGVLTTVRFSKKLKGTLKESPLRRLSL